MNVIVLIKSCHKYAARRVACRETWLSRLDWADYKFIVGQQDAGGLKSCQLITDDTVAFDTSDAFPNIAPKICHAFLYALSRDFDFAFVVDDDTYVIPERLKESEYWRHDYAGYVRIGDQRFNNGKPYIQGAGYWVSARAMECAFRSDILRRNGIIDDGAVGQALYGRVPFVHDDRYEPGPDWHDRYPEKNNNVITTHKCLPDGMRAIHGLWNKECAH